MIAPLFVLLATTSAADEATTPSSPAPPLAVIAFQGRPGGACTDRTLARRGRCLDVVDFLPLQKAGGTGRLTPAEVAALGDVAWLYGHVWDDVAIRWNATDVQQTLRKDGYTALPPVGVAWERVVAAGDAWSVPDLDLVLGDGTWFVPSAPPSAPRHPGVIYPSVRFAAPPGQVLPDPVSVLRGRFALRLGAGGKSHDYDVMDADPASSAPFFEQLFPYTYSVSQRSEQDEVYRVAERIPLVAFRHPGASVSDRTTPSVVVRDLDNAETAALAQFETFFRTVFVQTAQFALEDYTTNQMRVLAALTAIATPPGAAEFDAELSRDLVAAARHETDRAEDVLVDQGRGRRTSTGSALLRHEALPRVVLARWVPWLEQRLEIRDAERAALAELVVSKLGGILRYGAVPLMGTEAEARTAWVKENVLPGEDLEETDARVLRIALGYYLDVADRRLDEARRKLANARLTASEEAIAAAEREVDEAGLRARVEAWLLADHARFAIASTFNPTRRSSPNEVAGAATQQWQTIIGQHGHAAAHRPQGLGAVDPLAVCTTKDGLAALDELTFGAVDVDLLVPAPDGLSGRDVLAAGGHTLPFVFLDDPTREPVVTRLVALGDGRALYRARWRVWTGWHLLWGLSPEHEDGRRLVLRTAAICDDMVLAPSEIVPTVVRAGLLYGNLRPTTPERPKDVSRRKIDLGLDEPDDVAQRVEEAPGKVGDVRKQVEDVRELVEERPFDKLVDLAPKPPAQEAFEIVQEPLSPEASWLRDLVVPRLAARGDGGRLLAFVTDTSAPDRHALPDDVFPRTPYFRTSSRVPRSGAGRPPPDGRLVRTAAWLWYLSPKLSEPVQLAPAFRPRPSVQVDDRIPRWSRRHTVDWHLRFGVGGYPFETIRWRCAEEAPSSPTFGGPCEGDVHTAGASIDMQAVANWWASDHPRVGLNVGLEARLDVRPGGFPLYPEVPEPPVSDPAAVPRLPWALRFQGGLLLGFQHAPGAGPLRRDHPRAALWGTPDASGRTLLRRTQWGMVGGLLFGTGFNGAAASANLETWVGWSVLRPRRAAATLAPYHPTVLLGPFVRGTYGFPLVVDETSRQLVYDHGWAAYVGLRTHLRLKRQAKLPEAP